MPAIGTTAGHSEAGEQAGSSPKRKRHKVRHKKPDKITKIANKVARDAEKIGAKAYHDAAVAQRRAELRAGRRAIRRSVPPEQTITGQDPSTYEPISDEEHYKQLWENAEEQIGDEVESDIRKTDPEAIHPGVGLASKIAKPAAEVATLLGGTGALKVGGRVALKIAAKGSEKAAAELAAREAAKTAGKRTIESAGERTAAKTAAKAETKAAQAEAKVQRAIRRKNTTAAQRAKEATRKGWKKHQPDIASKAGRKVAVRRKATSVNRASLSNASTVVPVGAGIVSSTGAALMHDPGKTLKTTARAIPGVIAPIKLAAETYESGKNVVEGNPNPLAPLEKEGKAQLDYYKGLAEIAKGTDKGQKLIEEDYGLVPAITAGLGLHAATRRLRAPRVAGERTVVRDGLKPVRVKKLRERVADPDNPKAEDAARILTEAETGKGAKRRRVAQRLDSAKRRAQAGHHEDLREMGVKGEKATNLRNLYRDLRGTKLNDRIDMSDVAHLVMPEGIPLDRNAGRAALIELRDGLSETDKVPSPRAKSTREVVDAILERPELLELPELKGFWDAAGSARKDISVGRHEDRVGVEEAAGTPDPFDERPRLLNVARSKNIDLPEERPHPELRELNDEFGLPKIKRYEDHDKLVREQAKRLRTRAKRAEAQAVALRKSNPERAAILEAKATSLRAGAEARLAVVTRDRQARKLDAEALAHEEAGDLDAARASRSRAIELREKHQAGRDARLNEFRSDVQNVIDSGERRDPVFFHSLDAQQGLKGPSGGAPKREGVGLAAGDKMDRGFLRDWGLIDHRGQNMMEGLFRDRMNQEMGRALRDIINEFTHTTLPIVTGHGARQMIERGEAPVGYGLIPVQEFKRAYAAGDWEAAMKMVKKGVRGKLDDAALGKGGKGKKYAWMSKAALDELYGQMKPVGRVGSNLKHFGAAQSFALLGSSPTWVAFQLLATPMLMLARHPNPRTWMRLAKTEVDVYKKLTPRERRAFDAEIGGNVGDVYGFKNLELGATPNNIRSMRDASHAASQTLAGRTLRSIFSGGGPFIKGVAKYEGKLRHLQALMEMDKLHNHSAPRKFLGSLAALDDATRKHIDKLSGLSRAEQARHYAKHPEDARFLAKKVNDAIGDWSSLTKFEKNASSVLIFYPFLRFSLKWIFQTFPKENPIKAAILANFAQQNAQEVEKMLGGTPSFFASWGQVPFRNGEGHITGGVNLARVAPGSNALIEGVAGDEDLNMAQFGRLFQPILSSALLQGWGGLDPFSGEKVADTLGEHGLLFLKQIMGLNPITRAAVVPKIAPSSDISKLFQTRSPWEKSLIPDITFNAAEERQKAALGRTLDASGNAPTPEELSAYVDDLRARGIQPNEYNIRNDPAGQALIARARKADKASEEVQGALRSVGLGDDKEAQEAFGTIYGLTNPFGGFTPKKKVRRKTKPSGTDWGSGGTNWGSPSSTKWGTGGTNWGSSSSTNWGS